MNTIKKPNKRDKWKPINLVLIYRMVRLGFTEVDIAKSLGITTMGLWKWQRDKPELAEAVAMAKKERSEEDMLPQWIYSRLTPELQEIWKKIDRWDKQKGGAAKIEMILQDHGKAVRQQLFLHALSTCRFSCTRALAKVNVTKREFDNWLLHDVDFAELVDEVEWHKGNFFESALIGLVEAGEPGAVVFASKTFNAERGYGIKARVDHNVSGTVMHGVVDLLELAPFMKEETRTDLLEAIRLRELQQTSKGPKRLDVVETITREISNV